MKLWARGLVGWVVVLSAVGCECGAGRPELDPLSLVIEPATLTLEVGAAAPLKARRVNGEDVTDRVTWSSDDGALARVENGMVTGVGPGQVRITAALDAFSAGADVAVNPLSASCTDGVRSGDETDVDCGGPTCTPCSPGLACESSSDCDSAVCRTGRCQAPSCDDRVRNRDESEVDCGGLHCTACGTGQACQTNTDCASQVCVGGVCRAPTCSDGATNGRETDIDCGGPDCDACGPGGQCTTPSDCSSAVCVNGQCAADTCGDGVRNGLETGIDCGGPGCAACGVGGGCLQDADCGSQVCVSGVCVAPTCTDQRRNGDETGPDCGGPTCPRCATGFTCGAATDCLSGVCTGDVCQPATCSDGVQNGTETAVDCGGSSCAACGAGQACTGATDCLSRVCQGGVCQAAACDDGVQNGLETGLDCGGARCGPCADGQGCQSGADCTSLACSQGVCVPPSCTDGVRNGQETAADCGGPLCAACGTGASCTRASDCASGVCAAGSCAAPTCSDGVRNGQETATDCGGGTCTACGPGLTCDVNADCASGHCESGACGAPFVASVAVTPGAASLPLGRTQVFRAVEVLSDGTTRDVTATAGWSSSDATVAPISPTGTLSTTREGAVVVRAVSSGVASDSVTVQVTPAVVVSLEVAPVGVQLPIGLVEAFRATGTFTDGTVRDVTSTASWSSSDVAVATIAPDGRATAQAAGSTRISATRDGVTGTVELTVTPVFVTGLTVAPDTLRLPIGVRAALSATALLSDGSARDVTTQAAWSTSAAAVAQVDAAGLVTALTAGTADLSATLAGFTASTALTVVSATVTTVQVFPADETIPRGFEVRYAAVGLFSDGNAYDLTLSAAWSSTAPAVATVGTVFPEQGLVRTLSVGTTSIAARFGGQSGETSLTVNDATLTSLAISPASITLPTQLAWQYRATGVFSDGTAREVTTLVHWQTGQLAVATISNALGSQGRLFTHAGGQTTVIATLGGRTATAQLTVTTAALESVSVSPPSAQLGLQGVVSLVATAVFADGTALDVTELSGFSSSAPSVALVRNDAGFRGVTVGLSSGNARITATFRGVQGVALIAVSNANLQELYISPAVVRTGLGIDVQFNVSGLWADGTTADLTRVATWTSSQASVAVISNAIGQHGLATTRGVGVTTIGAAWAGQIDSTTLTVTNARLTAIAVTPGSTTTGVGAQVQLTATATFDDGTTFDVTRVAAWSSSDASVAAVGSLAGTLGLVTAIQGGTVTITAALGAVSGTASITVSGAALVGLQVTPAVGLIPQGYWLPYTATATYADGLVIDVTRVATWTTSDASILGAGNGALYGGRVTGLALGTATVFARFGTFGGQATGTVLALRLSDLEITPAGQSTPVGVPLQLTALGTFTDGTVTFVLDITQQVGWRVAPKKNGTVSNSEGTRGVVTMYNASSSANILAQAWGSMTGASMTGTAKVSAP